MCPAALLALCLTTATDPSVPLPALWGLMYEPQSYSDPERNAGAVEPDSPGWTRDRLRAVDSNGVVLDLAARVGRWWEDAVVAT